jgi:hypothetical protein
VFLLNAENVAEDIIEKLIEKGQLDSVYFEDGWMFDYSTLYVFILSTVLFCLIYYVPMLVSSYNRTIQNKSKKLISPISISIYSFIILIATINFPELAVLLAVPTIIIVVIAIFYLCKLNRHIKLILSANLN